LRDAHYYRDDPMVLRLPGLTRLPDVATVSRCLAEAGTESVERVRQLCRELALERLVALGPRRVTVDFDGSVIGTGRWAEGHRGRVRTALRGVIVEARLDGAFFSDEIVRTLAELGVEFSISVPFERFVELKQRIEGRRPWRRLNTELASFEDRWKPKSWPRRYRFVVLRTCHRRRSKEPVQDHATLG
jgi:hypothetical protein